MRNEVKEWHIHALELDKRGVSWRGIASEIGVPRSTVSDFLRKIKVEGAPKILVLDIETAPALAYTFSRWKVNIGQKQVIREGYILTFSAKWYGAEDIIFAKLPDYAAFYQDQCDDSAICASLHALLDEADFIIAHNGRKFDLSVINARFVANGYLPPSPYKIIDTLDIAKKAFRFPSNSLESLAEYLQVEHRKLSTNGFELWRDVMANVDQAWEEMMTYNMMDVIVLEEVYNKLRPWYVTHPNVGVTFTYQEKPRCAVCGGLHLEETDKFYYTNLSKFSVLRCTSCGKMNRGRINKLDRTNLAVGV